MEPVAAEADLLPRPGLLPAAGGRGVGGEGRSGRKLLDSLVSELGVHVKIEDELFYPAVRDVTSLFAISQAEHRQIDDQLAVVLRTDTGGPDFLIELNMLIATLEHHAGEEERVMFPQSHALGEAALESLGKRMQTRQQQLRHSTFTQLLRSAKREVLRHV